MFKALSMKPEDIAKELLPLEMVVKIKIMQLKDGSLAIVFTPTEEKEKKA